MKKILIGILLILCLFLVACDKEEETEITRDIGYGTHPFIDPLTTQENETSLTMEDISPSVIDVTVPEDLIIKVSDIDFDAFEEIDIKDSFVPKGGHDKVLESENAQYFFVDDDIKVHVVFFELTEDGKKDISASASYNTETGFVEFYGDENRTWYFNEDGTFRCLVFTYDGENHDRVPVYTFYDTQGNRDVVRSVEGWFDANIDALSQEDTLNYIEKYKGTSEATAQY